MEWFPELTNATITSSQKMTRKDFRNCTSIYILSSISMEWKVESIWTRFSNIYCPLKNSSSICWNVSFQPFFHFTPELGTNPYVFYTQIVLISGNTQLWFTLWCLSLKGILLRYKQVQGLTVQKIRLVTFKKLLQCAYLFWNGKKTMILKFVDY